MSAVDEARKALRCLYIAVDESVARDVEAKCLAAFRADAAEIARLRARVEKLERVVGLVLEHATDAVHQGVLHECALALDGKEAT